jgi:alpha-ketoglutarate-dependent taurine dioxygenase
VKHVSNSKPSLRQIAATKRELRVQESLFSPGAPLPLVLTAQGQMDLVTWATNHISFLEARLLEHGAVLFRGFSDPTIHGFERFIEATSDTPMQYRERSSPRRNVAGKIYTSTDYPARYEIFPHNENSYAQVWPLKIYFYCQKPPSEGGETPLVDVRKVYQRISSVTREKFERLAVMYVRNFDIALGISWQSAFQTNDKQELAEYCRRGAYDFEWKDSERLRTRRVGQAVAIHPRSGERVWFNHAVFFHISTLHPDIRNALLSQVPEEDLPNHTCYGDGSPIEPQVIEEIRTAYLNEKTLFRWEQGDVLMVDNMLTAHGRSAYKGERNILVGMSEPYGK